MNIEMHYERRYRMKGRVAHLIASGDLEQEVPHARCGEYPGDPLTTIENWQWWGTGSQDEIDKAATMPTCRNCLKGLERDKKSGEKADRELAAFRNAD
jgi:hypothetical protein